MAQHPNSLKNLEKRKPFKPGDPRINRQGAPRKLTKNILSELEANGIDKVSGKQVRETIETLLNCTQKELKNYANASRQPFIVNVLANHLLEAKDDTRFLNSLLDRAQGKATERKEITHTTAPQSLSELYNAEEAEVIDEG